MVQKMNKKLIKISTNSRIHMGFFSHDIKNPYSYGGIGLCINKYPTVVSITPVSQFSSNLSKNYQDKIIRFLDIHKLSKKIHIKLVSSPDRHIGLGSGTQLILSIEESLMRYFNLSSWPNIYNRNYRSGIGYNTYKHGGFIIDSPKRSNTENQIIFKHKFPKDWNIILLFDYSIRGANGKIEKEFFLNNKVMHLREKLSDITLNEIIPSILYQDYETFTLALTKFQYMNSKFYSSIQKSPFISKDVHTIIKKLSDKYKFGYGQSSWGPTSYIITKSNNHLNKILSVLDNLISMYNNLAYNVVSAKNSGRKLIQ